MSLAYQTLWMLVLLVSGSVAVLPLALKESAPQAFSAPVPRTAQKKKALWLVETAKGHWFVNGTPLPPHELGSLLRHGSDPKQVHYLPSNALPFERVSRSMRWLKARSQASIVLEMSSGILPDSP
jgi:hypothetical protein